MSKYVLSNIPSINRSRSRFDLSHGHKTSATLGYLYPLDPIEVLPGDTFKFNMSMVCRLSSTLIKPVMDNLFVDLHYFFVPKRILFDKFEEMYGKAAPSDWLEPEDIELPLLGVTGSGFSGVTTVDSAQNGARAQVACHMGFPVGQDIGSQWTDDDNVTHYIMPSVLPFRAFAMVYNEFFRDENLIDPMNVIKGETGAYEYLNSSSWSPSNYTGCVPKVSKLHDLFTSVLPSPQKGDAVTVPLSLIDDIPVVTGSNHPHEDKDVGMNFKTTNYAGFTYENYTLGGYDGSFGSNILPVKANGDSQTTFQNGFDVYPANLWATAGDYQSSLTVNDLRFAFQYQKRLEQAARSGSRFVEWLKYTFGVNPGDGRLQRPEYLGGKRIPLNISTVMQTTGYNSDSSKMELGQLGGQSATADRSACRWTKSFTEPGYLIGCFCIRQFHSYQQGLSKHWYKKKRIDFYEPVFANIGEQPVFKYQLYSSIDNLGGSYPGHSGDGNPKIFGYQEAWQEYRQIPNVVTGQMNSGANDSLDVWHLGDVYASSPALGKTWIEEDESVLDDHLSVESTSQDQFIIDFWEGISAIRCMPLYSVPGLIDHH